MSSELQPDAFEGLLRRLHEEREQAGALYEVLRRRLLKFFEWRGCTDATRLADATFDRVARQLSEGLTILSADPAPYFLGVARYIWQEDQNRTHRQASLASSLPAPAVDPAAQYELEQTHVCLDACLARLPADDRATLEEYYRGQGRERSLNRQRMASALGLSLGPLRVRVHRIRARLETCVQECLEARDLKRTPPAGHQGQSGRSEG